MKKYYYSDGSEKFGPFTLNELKTKQITKENLVWFAPMEDWKAAGEVPELSVLFEGSAVSTPGPNDNFRPNNNKGNSILKVFLISASVVIGVSGIVYYINSPGSEQEEYTASENEYMAEIDALIEAYSDSLDALHEEAYAESEESIEEISNETGTEPFYILNVAAFKREDEAISMVGKLQNDGYQANYLWIPDFESLSKKEYYSVYIGPFSAQKECEIAVEEYRENVDPNAYGLLVSQENKRVKITGINRIKVTEPYH